MKLSDIKTVIVDLDGTLLNSNKQISSKDFQTLVKLKEKNKHVIIATGRSMFSANKVLSSDFPIDFLIFSNGAGILDWKTKNIILKHQLTKIQTQKVAQIFIDNYVDFMIQDIIPDNHKYQYYKTAKPNPDFFKRNEIYKDYIKPIDFIENYEAASQFIAIIPEGVEQFNLLVKKLNILENEIQIIRATSPLDGQTIWMEIFPKGVSKGFTLIKACNLIGCNMHETISIGNDYNDVPMLSVTKYSYVVANAPDELKALYYTTDSNDNNGFSMIFERDFSL